jgi:hypothetical protein
VGQRRFRCWATIHGPQTARTAHEHVRASLGYESGVDRLPASNQCRRQRHDLDRMASTVSLVARRARPSRRIVVTDLVTTAGAAALARQPVPSRRPAHRARASVLPDHQPCETRSTSPVDLGSPPSYAVTWTGVTAPPADSRHQSWILPLNCGGKVGGSWPDPAWRIESTPLRHRRFLMKH